MTIAKKSPPKSYPRADAAKFGNIPQLLKDLPQWVCWRAELDEKEQKFKKPPIDPKNSHLASSNDPETWGTFGEAVARFKKDRTLHGIGFQFTQDDPFTFIDLDNAKNGSGVEPWAQEIIGQLNSYTETSPSGTGVHIIVEAGSRLKGKKNGIEVYAFGQYATYTGDILGDTPTVQERTGALADVYAKVFGAPKPEKPPAPVENPPASLEPYRALRDDRLLEAIRRREPAFEVLWEKRDQHGESEGDFALACLLIRYTGRDLDRVEKLLRASKRLRDKWDKHRTYLRELTIERANEKVKNSELWTPPGRLEAYSVADLHAAAKEKVGWYAWPFLAPGFVAILDGPPKSAGKTTLNLVELRAILEEKTFLGQKTQRAPIAYVSEQSKPSLDFQLRQAGMPEVPPEKICFLTRESWSRYTWVEFLSLFEEQWLVPLGIKIVVFDTFYSIARVEEESNASQINTAARPLLDLGSRLNLAVKLVRHDRKSGGDIGVSGRGSSQLTGLVDIIGHLTRPAGQAQRSKPNLRVLDLIARVALPDRQLIELVDSRYVNRGERGDVKTADFEERLAKSAPTTKADAKPILKILPGEKMTQPLRDAIDSMLKTGALKMTTRNGKSMYWTDPPPCVLTEEM